MRLGKASAYAVFATTYLAERCTAEPIQGRDIARACGIPAEYLLKILQQLVRSQVLISERGRSGGFRLRHAPEETTLLAIVEAIEGPLNGELSVRREIQGADQAKDTVEGLCNDIAAHARSLLSRTTIRSLMTSE